jgi:hypothetical protein
MRLGWGPCRRIGWVEQATVDDQGDPVVEAGFCGIGQDRDHDCLLHYLGQCP